MNTKDKDVTGSEKIDRRGFVLTLTKVVGTSSLLMASGGIMAAEIKKSQTKFKVAQIIELIIKDIPGAPFKDTVDTLKSGSPDQVVTGIVSTTFATISVIEKAARLGANFIIAHEPTFYNHNDSTDWLESDTVYQYKRDLLKKYNIAVWRFHDYWHTNIPDGVQMGVLTTLGWDQYADKNNLHIINLPTTSLKQIVAHVKSKLEIDMLRVMGDLSQECKRIALLPGAPGGKEQITAVQQIKPDLLIGGELREWETSEYIRDAESMGKKLSLIVLGHAVSEEPGMKWLVQWLQPKVPGVTITHVPSRNHFKFM